MILGHSTFPFRFGVACRGNFDTRYADLNDLMYDKLKPGQSWEWRQNLGNMPCFASTIHLETVPNALNAPNAPMPKAWKLDDHRFSLRLLLGLAASIIIYHLSLSNRHNDNDYNNSIYRDI